MKKLFTLLFCGIVLFTSAAEKPLAKVGLLTDTHVTPRVTSCRVLKKAFELFKAQDVDMILNAGDVANTHKVEAYKNYRDTYHSVFTDKKPKQLFSFAWHDVIDMGNWFDGWKKAWPSFKKGLEIEHELYSRHYLGGYIFLTAPQSTDWVIYEKMIADACKETPGKPVFLLDHVPAGDTTFNTNTWGNARVRRVLSKYPQVIQLSGHTHGSFRNELQIWQGEFTAINLGCCGEVWAGALIGNAPKSFRSEDAFVMELYKDKLIIRRFDLALGIEYKKDTPWCIPLPFDPATAPYTQKARSVFPAPEFAANCKVTARPDKVPFNSIQLTFPEAKSKSADGVFVYTLELFRKDKAGKWEGFSTREVYGGFMKEPHLRKTVSVELSAGFFDSGKSYKIRITPRNFYGRKGNALESVFSVPEKAEHQVVYETFDPMKDCVYMTDLEKGKKIAVKNGFYQHPGGNTRLEFPKDVWKAPAKARFRFTVDMQMKQPGSRFWTVVLRNPVPVENANNRIATPAGDSGVQRYVIEFAKRKDFHNYYLLIREGHAGEIRFNYVRIERLDQ